MSDDAGGDPLDGLGHPKCPQCRLMLDWTGKGWRCTDCGLLVLSGGAVHD